jgi:tetratricopeptide (TPR) repeat protein
MKEDKLVTYYFKTTEYVRRNSRTISTGVTAFGIILLVLFLYQRNKHDKETKASVEFTKARTEYFQNNYESAINILQDLVDNFGGTKSAKEATYYLANAYFQTKKYDDAERYYQKYLESGDDDILKASALSGIAASYEERGNYAEAAKTYKKAAEKYSNGFLAPENLYNAARCFVLAGNKEAASDLLKKLLENYSDSNLKNDAEILLAELNT